MGADTQLEHHDSLDDVDVERLGVQIVAVCGCRLRELASLSLNFYEIDGRRAKARVNLARALERCCGEREIAGTRVDESKVVVRLRGAG